MTSVLGNLVPLFVQADNCDGHTHLFLGSISSTPPVIYSNEVIFVNDEGEFFYPFAELIATWN